MDTLVLIEHNGQTVKRSSLSALTLARRLAGDYALALLGTNLAAVAESVRPFGAGSVWVADHPVLTEPLADRHAEVLAAMARKLGCRTVIGTGSTYTKDVLPRVAALLDAAMLSEVTAVDLTDGEIWFQCPVQAGSLSATVTLEGEHRVITVRGTAFPPPAPDGARSPVERFEVDPAALPTGTEFVARESRTSSRPDLTEARVVIGGGRPLNDKETFERLIGGLADALGGAVAATRAAVDADMAPNDCQVGQTGKVVAPELYIAVGVSGAVQHMAGVQDSKVIVAINRDPEAAVFQMANYGLVGDLHEIVPRLIDAVRS